MVQGNCTQREHLMLKASQNEKHADVERGQNWYFDTLTLMDNYVETTIGWIQFFQAKLKREYVCLLVWTKYFTLLPIDLVDYLPRYRGVSH